MNTTIQRSSMHYTCIITLCADVRVCVHGRESYHVSVKEYLTYGEGVSTTVTGTHRRGVWGGEATLCPVLGGTPKTGKNAEKGGI